MTTWYLTRQNSPTWGRTSHTDPPAEPPAPRLALAGKGVWIWQEPLSIQEIIATCKQYGFSWVTIKDGERGHWGAIDPNKIAACEAEGITLVPWVYLYGQDPAMEARMINQCLARGAKACIMDVEFEWRNLPNPRAAAIQMFSLIEAGPEKLIYAPIPQREREHYIPWDVFDDNCCAAMPQFYVPALLPYYTFESMFRIWQNCPIPVQPVLQGYLDPRYITPEEIADFKARLPGDTYSVFRWGTMGELWETM